MSEKKKNLIAVAVGGVILCGAMLFTLNPELDLKDAILGLVNLPSKVFSYLMPKEEPIEVPTDEPLEELLELPKQDTYGEQEVNETPLLVFDHKGEEQNQQHTEETAPTATNPDAAEINVLPTDHLG